MFQKISASLQNLASTFWIDFCIYETILHTKRAFQGKTQTLLYLANIRQQLYQYHLASLRHRAVSANNPNPCPPYPPSARLATIKGLP